MQATTVMSRSDDGIFTDAFVREVAERLLPDAQALTGDRARARDLLADALSRAYERRDQLRHADRAVPWCRAILFRTFVDGQRRIFRARTVSLDLVELSTPPVSDALIDLRAAVTGLSRPEQLMLYLRFGLGYSIDETAATLQLPAGTVKSRLHRTLRSLRTRLGGRT